MVTIDHCNLVALADSGADVSPISESAFRKIKARNPTLCIDRSQSVQVRALGADTPIHTLGTIHLDIGLDNFIASDVDLHVVKDSVMSHDLILGVDLLSKYYLAPSPAHRQLLYLPPDMTEPVFVGQPVNFNHPVTLNSTAVLKPNSICFLTIEKPEVEWREAIFEPNIELLEKQIAFSRCLVTLDDDCLHLEVACFSPTPLKLKKSLEIGTLSKTEEFNFGPEPDIPDTSFLNSSVPDMFDLETAKLTPSERDQVYEMLFKYEKVVSSESGDVGRIDFGCHTIRLSDPLQEPIKIPPRRLHGKAKTEVEGEVSRLYEEAIIEPSDSPWSAPVVPIYKPDGTVRLCIDYRALNKVTLKDAYPLPNLEDTIYNLHGVKYFTSLDLVRGYYQVPMDPESKPYTSFVTSSGQWQFCRMPFGLCNAPATFQRLMNTMLQNFPVDRVMVYLDDLLVISKTFQEHLSTVDSVLATLQENGLKIKPSKCQLFQDKVKFLGHVISADGLGPLEENVKAVQEYPSPRTIKSVQRFMGMVNFYRRFIPKCSTISKPLTALLSTKKLVWTEKCQEAFDALKSALTNPPVLGFPDFESNEPLNLHTDASQFGAGACLSQKQDGGDRVIAFISTTFNEAEVRYSVLDKELAAIRWAIKRLKPFLWGRHFIVHTDHKPLSYLQGMRLLDGRLARTLEELGDYDFTVQYVPGHLNTVADALSRDSLARPVPLSGEEQAVILQGMSEVNVKSGADSLFRCFSLYFYGTEEEHAYLRTLLLDDLLLHPTKYNIILTKSIRRQLRLMKFPGVLPYFECIQAFSNLIKAPVYVYEDLFGFVMYNPEERLDENPPCHLRSYDGVAFVGLLPESPESDLDNRVPADVLTKPLSPANMESENILYPLFVERTTKPQEPDLSMLSTEPAQEITFFEIRYPKTKSPDISELSVDPVRPTKQPKKVTVCPNELEVRYYRPQEPPSRVSFPVEDPARIDPDNTPWRETFDCDTLREWQKGNRPLNTLIQCLLERNGSPCKHRRKHDKYRKHLRFITLNQSGLLVKEQYFEHLTDPVYPYLVPFVPACDLVRLAHLRNAHVGKDKLLHLVQPYIFHPSLQHIVADVTRSCDHCQRNKVYSQHKAPPTLKIQAKKPFEKVHVDVLQLPNSALGYKYVLNAVDQYSKLLASQPLKDKTSQTVQNAFRKILSGFPTLPERVISDNGGEFTGEPFRRLLNTYNIKHTFIIPYSPQSNGLVERINRTLMSILNGLDTPSRWCSALTQAVIVYNNTYHKELKCTPSEFLTGLAAKLPVHPEEPPTWKKGSPGFKPYSPGELVGLKDPTRSGVSKKLNPRYSGPYKVLEVHSNQKTYVIEHKRNRTKTVRAHHSQLRPWHNAPAYLQKSTVFLPNTPKQDSQPYTEPEVEMIPGLKNLSLSRPKQNLLVHSSPVDIGSQIPEVVPGLNRLKCITTPAYYPAPVAVANPVPEVISTPSRPVASTPKAQRIDLRNTALTDISMSPIDPGDRFNIVSLDSHMSPPSEEFILPARLPVSNESSTAEYSFRGFDDVLPSAYPVHGQQGPSLPISGLLNESRSLDSSFTSLYSFREQTPLPATDDAAAALRALFPFPPSPLDATYLSDADLPSLDISARDSGENMIHPGGPVRQLFLEVPEAQPIRLTRARRAELYPGVNAEEALERFNQH